MLRGAVRVVDPGNVRVEMTLTTTVEQWRRVRAAIREHATDWTMLEQLDNNLRQIVDQKAFRSDGPAT